MESRMFVPQLTAEVAVPPAEPGKYDMIEGPLPACLARRAGRARSRRNLLLLAALLVAIIALEALLLAQSSAARTLVVYDDRDVQGRVKP